MKEAIRGALEEAIQRLAPEANVEITLERPRHKAHGDYACNAAMQLARVLKRNPREIAAAILEAVAWPEGVARAEVAGPGFINIFLEPGAENRVLARILTDPSWSRPNLGHGARVLVEYVSANPTGPMHVGHGRGAVVGDAIANLLAHTGWQVEREYYINDAGNQVRTLARTVWLRMRELMGEEITLPEDAYPAPYVIEIARAALEKKPFADWAAMDEAEREDELGRFAVDWNMREIRACLDALGIRFDRFVSERALHEEGAVARAIEALQAKGAVYRGVLPPPKGKPVDDYEPREQLLFRATAYGDETDRPLVKSDGSYTYFAADIAYHADKLRRGYARLINVWGADHGGYVKRLQAAVEALSGRKGCPEVVLVQMVRITREGKPVRLSKRAGNIVALDELVREVGKDAVRFNMLTRRAEAQFAFDIALAKAQTEDNPVFYVQYAHARICAILRRAEEAGAPIVAPDAAALERLTAPEEAELVAKLADWPEVVREAASRLEPHRIANYAMELAAAFHAFYHQHRVIVEDEALAAARLVLVRAVKHVLAEALGLAGVDAPERM